MAGNISNVSSIGNTPYTFDALPASGNPDEYSSTSQTLNVNAERFLESLNSVPRHADTTRPLNAPYAAAPPGFNPDGSTSQPFQPGQPSPTQFGLNAGNRDEAGMSQQQRDNIKYVKETYDQDNKVKLTVQAIKSITATQKQLLTS